MADKTTVGHTIGVDGQPVSVSVNKNGRIVIEQRGQIVVITPEQVGALVALLETAKTVTLGAT
jgi:hypothetical protein